MNAIVKRRFHDNDPSRWPDLPDVVQAEGFPLRRQNRSWGGNTCPECGESSAHSNKFSVYIGRDGRWRYKCLSCGVYGDTADFLALARSVPIKDALAELNGPLHVSELPQRQHRAAASAASLEETRRLKAIGEVTQRLKVFTTDTGAMRYLKGRGLSEATIKAAIDSGQLRMLPIEPKQACRALEKHVGHDLLVQAGIQRSGSKWPSIAFKPLLAIEPGCGGFEARVATKTYDGPKAIRYGRIKWPWYFAHNEHPATVCVTEGIIDGLSAWQSLPEAEAVMAVPGVNGWRSAWFEELHRKRDDIIVLVGFDGDDAGQTMAVKLVEELDRIGLAHEVIRPPRGKDWNEALVLSAFL